jgi:hypothetical protein
VYRQSILSTTIIGLRFRQTNGILTYGAHNLLTGHHNISDADLETARTARTDPRALQNAKAVYKCLKKSVTGNLRSTLFGQASNLMTNAKVAALRQAFQIIVS